MEAATGAWAEFLGVRFAFPRCHPAVLVSLVLFGFEPLCAPFCCVQKSFAFSVVLVRDQRTIAHYAVYLRARKVTSRSIGQVTCLTIHKSLSSMQRHGHENALMLPER